MGNGGRLDVAKKEAQIIERVINSIPFQAMPDSDDSLQHGTTTFSISFKKYRK